VIFFGGACLAGILAGIASACGHRRGDRAYWQGVAAGLLNTWRVIADRLGILHFDPGAAAHFTEARGTIFVSNHPSLMDGLMLAATIPRAVCVMRDGLGSHPAFATIARLAGYLPSSGGAALVRAGMRSLARGENLIIFPEGTRSRSDKPGPFKAGFALIAKGSGAPVQCLHARFEGAYFRKGRSLLSRAEFPVRLRFSAGPRMELRPGESAKAFARRVEREFHPAGDAD